MIAWSPIYHRIIIILERIKPWYCCKLNVHTAVYSQMVRLLSIQYSRSKTIALWGNVQYIPRNMHTVFALRCFVVIIHWPIFPYPSGLLHWHCGNLTIASVPAKQPWWIWINTSGEFIMNDCITTTKQSTTKPCAYFLGYTVYGSLATTFDQPGWIVFMLCAKVMKDDGHIQAPARKQIIYTHTHTHIYIYIYIYLD